MRAVYEKLDDRINSAQTAAAHSGVIPANARALQDRWNSVIHVRVALQFVAIAALCTAVALA